MTKEVLKMALEALERCVATCFDPYAHEQVMSWPEHFVNQTITAIKEALAQPNEITLKEFNQSIYDDPHYQNWKKEKEVQSTWVGLSDDDRVLIKHDANYNQFMTAGEYADIVQQLTEARLKDKNHV